MMRLLLVLLALIVVVRADPVGHAGAASPEPAAKRIAISFDDAPRNAGAFLDVETRAVKLLAALEAAGVRQAAFYVNPGRITQTDGDAERLAAYAAAGHVLADHSATHKHLSKTGAAEYLADIDAAEAWLKPRPGYRPWFRFPFLDEGGRDKAKRDAVRAGLKARGLRNGYVTIDGSDWNMEQLAIDAVKAGRKIDMTALRDLYVETHVESAEFADRLAVRTIGRSPAHVLLLHETDLAALFVADLVAALRKQGWEVITNDEAYADPVFNALPDTPFANGTLTEMMAWEKGLPPPRWYERNDVDIANALFAERVLKAAK